MSISDSHTVPQTPDPKGIETHARAHVFTDAPIGAFYKQFPGNIPSLKGVSFSFGLDVPQSDIDVLIVYNRASYTIRTHLPRCRTVFVAAEPDVIHRYKRSYLNQYGLVLSASDTKLETDKWQMAACWYWIAGIDYSKPTELGFVKGYDYFAALEPGDKCDKISIVSSTKVYTEYHRKRVRFIEEMQRLIPEYLELHGRGYSSIGDKADALTPCKYHLAIENGSGPHTWTEKLADPLLCWAFPFYAGCTNVEDYLPKGSYCYIDLNRPEGAARKMTELLQGGLWQRAQADLAEARRRILNQYNLSFLLAELTRRALNKPLTNSDKGPTRLRSERSLWPEKGARGGFADYLIVNAAMLIDKQVELKSIGMRRKLELKRSLRRRRRLEVLEKSRYSNSK